jgi:hypothetical protein
MRRLPSISSSGSGIAAITASAAASRVSAWISLASYVPRSRIRPGQSARPISAAAAAPMGPFASPSLSIVPILSIVRRSAASEAANGSAISIASIRAAAAAAAALAPAISPTTHSAPSTAATGTQVATATPRHRKYSRGI